MIMKHHNKGRVLSYILGIASLVGGIALFARGRRKLGILLGTSVPTVIYRRLRRAV